MAQYKKAPVATATKSEVSPQNPAPQAADPLQWLSSQVRELVQQRRENEALAAMSRARIESPWISNAQGVCQLRLGNAQVALPVFRTLSLAAGGFSLRTDIPTVFKTNFATALLATNNLGGCLSVLEELRDAQHPAIQKINDAIADWKRELSLWQKLNWYFGGQPDIPVKFNYPPGDLD
jgi:hypothetical protein